MDPIDEILHRREVLNLGASQVAELRQLKFDYVRLALTGDLKVKLAELDLEEVLQADIDSSRLEPALP